MDFTIIWEVGDGYVGKSRPQKFEVSLSEFHPDAGREEIAEFIQEAIDEEAYSKLTYDLSNESVVDDILLELGKQP